MLPFQELFVNCFGAFSLYLSFFFYKVDIKLFCSSSIHRYKISMLSHSSDFVHEFSKCTLTFATSKRLD